MLDIFVRTLRVPTLLHDNKLTNLKDGRAEVWRRVELLSGADHVGQCRGVVTVTLDALRHALLHALQETQLRVLELEQGMMGRLALQLRAETHTAPRVEQRHMVTWSVSVI